MKTRSVIAAAAAAAAFAWLACAQCASARERTYYIAAQDVTWSYAPSNSNLEAGKALPPLSPAQLGWAYHKLLYRRYSDVTFRTAMPLPANQRYLGFLGPIIRAEVGDTVVVVFKNETRFPEDIEPQGQPIATKTAVAPGKTRTYRWNISERMAPGPSDGSSVIWMYVSGITSGDHVAGLQGPILVTRAGMARPDGSPRDVDREIVVGFNEVDESTSPTFVESVADRMTNPLHKSGSVAPFSIDNLFVGLNGYVYGNMPMVTLKRGERVRWYVFSSESTFDFHAPTWAGQTVLWKGHRSATIPLGVSDRAVADMIPDNPGVWQIYCTLNIHLDGGMEARYTVLR